MSALRLRYKGIKACFRFVCREGPEHGRNVRTSLGYMGPRVGKSRETTQRDRARLLKRERRTGGEREGEEKEEEEEEEEVEDRQRARDREMLRRQNDRKGGEMWGEKSEREKEGKREKARARDGKKRRGKHEVDGKRRIPREGEVRGDRASGQGMLVGSLMLLAMHAPYGSDQISDRLPSPSSLCQSVAAKWTALHCWNWYIPTRGSFSRLARARVFSFLRFGPILNYRLTNSSACVPTVCFSLSFFSCARR